MVRYSGSQCLPTILSRSCKVSVLVWSAQRGSQSRSHDGGPTRFSEAPVCVSGMYCLTGEACFCPHVTCKVQILSRTPNDDVSPVNMSGAVCWLVSCFTVLWALCGLRSQITKYGQLLDALCAIHSGRWAEVSKILEFLRLALNIVIP